MKSLVAIGTVLFLAFAVSEISAICCGRGKHNFCKDCEKTNVFGHRTCCGAGNGDGHGCNLVCCNCELGSCRQGHPVITFKSGWFLTSKYSCVQHYGDAETSDTKGLKDTWAVFNEIDRDNDISINPEEFMDALTSGLADAENAHLLASDLLKSNDAEEIGAFLDVVNEEDAAPDLARMIVKEFRAMDSNDDGFIQPGEFDKDLK